MSVLLNYYLNRGMGKNKASYRFRQQRITAPSEAHVRHPFLHLRQTGFSGSVVASP